MCHESLELIYELKNPTRQSTKEIIVGAVTGYATTPFGGNALGNAFAGALTGALGGAALVVSSPLLGLTLDGIANTANVMNACQ